MAEAEGEAEDHVTESEFRGLHRHGAMYERSQNFGPIARTRYFSMDRNILPNANLLYLGLSCQHNMDKPLPTSTSRGRMTLLLVRCVCLYRQSFSADVGRESTRWPFVLISGECTSTEPQKATA
jgi:hypothetical protein